MKIKKLIFALFSISNFLCIGQNGAYFTKDAFQKDSITPDYGVINFQQKTAINFSHLGQVATIKISEVYAYTDKNGELVRVHPKEGPQKMFVEGAICLYGHPFNKFEGRGGPCPEFTALVPNMELYISSTKKGDLLVANPKSLKKLLESDPEIFEIYKANKNALEAVCSYNKKHPSGNDKFYYRGK